MRWVSASLLILALAVLGQRAHPADGGGPRWLREEGDLQAFVAVYKVTLPGRDSFRYVEPDAGQTATMSAAALLALVGVLDGAALVLDRFAYDLVLFHDTREGGDYLILRERTPCARCWGLFILNRDPAARDVAIEVPHPLFDTNTPEFGIEAFVRTNAGTFLMAGAHRYANGMDPPVSDMARSTTSVFQRLHQVLTGPETHVLQYHGFSHDTRPADYPNVVLSDGSPLPHPQLAVLAAYYEEAGERIGIYDGERFTDLGATQNPQARYTRGTGGRFYHLEHDNTIRASAARRSELVRAVLRWLEAMESEMAVAAVRLPAAA